MPLIKAGPICLALLVACSSSEEGGEDVAECWDEIDNDGDGLIDCDDAGCIVLGICEGKIDTGEDVPDDQPEFCDPCEGSTYVWASVSAGEETTCALDEAGYARCWGENDVGQVSEVPDGQFSAIDLYGEHGCGLLLTGDLVCWGENDHGQADAPSGKFIGIAVGKRDSCAIRDSGILVCWGSNQTDLGSPPEGSFTQVSLGWNHACAVRNTGEIACWGENHNGEAVAPEGDNFSSVHAGESHTCALRQSGRVSCFGGNNNGESTPPDLTFSTVDVGHSGSCGTLIGDGKLQCWGGGVYTHGTSDLVPFDLPEIYLKQVEISRHNLCGVTTEGQVICWGGNSGGQSSPP